MAIGAMLHGHQVAPIPATPGWRDALVPKKHGGFFETASPRATLYLRNHIVQLVEPRSSQPAVYHLRVGGTERTPLCAADTQEEAWDAPLARS